MNDIMIFHNAEFGKIRTLNKDGKIWFVGKDVADSLGYKNTRDTLAKHVDNEDKLDGVAICDSIGRKQIPLFINESGLYSLILSSKLPTAKKFKRWVTSEVLPSIRKNGVYATEDTIEKAIDNPDFIIGILQALKKERKEKEKLADENIIMKPKAEYFNELVERNLLTNIRNTAKILKVKQNDFVKFLLDNKFLYRDENSKLLPYNAHIQDNLFEIKQNVSKSSSWVGLQTLITPKGIETFRLLLKRKDVAKNV